MPYGISIKCLNDTASPILRLWDEASSFEVSASMVDLNYPPHLTLAVLPDHPSHVDKVLEDVFTSQPRLSISFEGVGYFENDFLVLWARPRSDDALLELHAKLHRNLDPAICHEHYRVGRWVPHCSLATKVPSSGAKAAIEWAKQKQLEFSVEFDTADLVQFPPVAIDREYRLR
ncbi:2'-5' RNA ligase family protein [Rhizobium leguminosarum]|uniref:2'-5' RNA ligase family protein n=1 Tax=Rhizobium leguminosarum TaxID=384 RepID=A0A2Z4YGW6_RHILE|nr:2'-5' RNA ligase family protein [Rhizobium leguminosarum]AXA39433.1 2'-5' RNA ligase family protein [Rhizobium leguminosarum]